MAASLEPSGRRAEEGKQQHGVVVILFGCSRTTGSPPSPRSSATRRSRSRGLRRRSRCGAQRRRCWRSPWPGTSSCTRTQARLGGSRWLRRSGRARHRRSCCPCTRRRKNRRTPRSRPGAMRSKTGACVRPVQEFDSVYSVQQ
jgi:hypothetical protein